MAISNNQQAEWSLLERNFPSERLSVYIKTANGNLAIAYELFLWNTEASAAFWELIGYVEIAIRSIVDKQLIQLEPDRDWLISDNVFPATDPIRKVIQIARERAGSSTEIAHHHLVQQLPLGFFQTILSRRYLRLWPTIASGFKGGVRGSFSELSNLMHEFRTFRNRVGHHELLVNLDLANVNQKILRVAELADPEFKTWLIQITRVEEVLARKPILR